MLLNSESNTAKSIEQTKTGAGKTSDFIMNKSGQNIFFS